MRRTIEMVHENFRAILREPSRISLEDLTERDLKALGRKVDSRFREYKGLGFPVWRRLGLKGIEVPRLSLKSSPSCDLDRFFEEYDFEGADRKYTLMADIFHTEKFCFEGSGKRRYEISSGIDTFLALIEGKAEIEIEYFGNFRVSSGRFVVKNGSRLKVFESSISTGIEISSYYFYMEPGSTLEIYQGTAGKSAKVAKFIMIEGEGDFRVMAFPRVGSISSSIDVMYSSVVRENAEVMVSGRGFAEDGKVIFRGVMDARRGSRDAKLSEHFECLFLDENSSFEAIPSLFISENELSAEHGATAYEIPEDQVFYMMSRGFSEDEVKLAVAEGVFDGFDVIREFVSEHLNSRR